MSKGFWSLAFSRILLYASYYSIISGFSRHVNLRKHMAVFRIDIKDFFLFVLWELLSLLNVFNLRRSRWVCCVSRLITFHAPYGGLVRCSWSYLTGGWWRILNKAFVFIGMSLLRMLVLYNFDFVGKIFLMLLFFYYRCLIQ